MLRVIVVSVALLPMLAGCAATDTKMANNKGQKVECKALAALAMTKDCVDNYKKEGFYEVPATASAAPASTGTH
jgi:hypothetical protein